MFDKIYDKYKDRLDEEEIARLLIAEIDAEITRQLKEDVSSVVKELSVTELTKIKIGLSSGMDNSELDIINDCLPGDTEIKIEVPNERSRRKSKNRQNVRLVGKPISEG